jgi:hypothetical protein
VIEQLWRDLADLDEALERHVIDNTGRTAHDTAEALDHLLLRGSFII